MSINLFAMADHAINTQVAACQITREKNVFHRYLPVAELLPDSLFATSEEVDNEDCDTDTAWIDTDNRPGSKRVTDYASHYQTTAEKSAFVLTDDEMVARMVDSFINGGILIESPLGQVLKNMFKDCLIETGEG